MNAPNPTITAVERLLALVSGVPQHLREGWLMILLQPCADDSGSEPQGHTFVLGGLVATPDEWVSFIEDWQAELDEGSIKLDYFKMAEAMSFREQFDKRRGWDTELRDEKIDRLIDIILKHAQLGSVVSLRHADFQKYLQSIPLPQRNLTTDTPYMFLYAQFVFSLCEVARRFRSDCMFDYIFDEQLGFDAEVYRTWPQLKLFAQSIGMDRYLAGPPVFRNEKTFLPLQAADLFAWEHRNHLVKNEMPPTKRWSRLDTLRTFSMRYTEEHLRNMHGPLSGIAAEFATQNPQAEMLPAGKASRKRTKSQLRKGKQMIIKSSSPGQDGAS